MGIRRAARFLSATVFSVLVAACASAPEVPTYDPGAKLEHVAGATRVVLIPKAVDRIGIETTQVRQVTSGGRSSIVIPYAALIYDGKGDTFTYTNPEPLVFVRQGVRVADVIGDQVLLAEGPPAGTTIVIVGASQLLGIELGIGG